MNIRFWGARGSFATPGHQFLKYGGHTTSIEFVSASGQKLLVDLGTGATEFAKDLMKGAFAKGEGKLDILLTHTHLDHIQGLPFFTPFFIKGNEISIYGPEVDGKSLADILQNQLNGYYSPLYGLENLAAGVEVKSLSSKAQLSLNDFQIDAIQLPHGGASVLGFRINCDGKSAVVMTDVEHGKDGPSKEALRFAYQCDVLIHDSMFNDQEYPGRKGWGHSSVSCALDFGELTEAKSIVLTHHNPDSSDQKIDTMVAVAATRAKIPVTAAREGMVLEL